MGTNHPEFEDAVPDHIRLLTNPSPKAKRTARSTNRSAPNHMKYDISLEPRKHRNRIEKSRTSNGQGGILQRVLVCKFSCNNSDDAYTENASTGVTFFITTDGTLQYTSTNTGNTATFKYREIRFV